MIGATTPILGPHVDAVALAPMVTLVGAGIAVVLARALLRRHRLATPVCYLLAVLGVLATGAWLGYQWNRVRDDGPVSTVAGMVRVDSFAVFLGVVVLSATALSLLLAVAYLRREHLDAPEYLGLMLLSASGMLMMTTANDLVVVFLALEVLSIPLYVLAAFARGRLASQEAGLKYFVLGAFSSAVFLYGVALVYGATGTTSLTGIGSFLAEHSLFRTGTLMAGLALLLVGLGFKVAAVPFHMWTPDVYQGSPTPVTAFMASATKAAGFAALLRVFGVAFPLYRADWRPAAWGLAAVTLVVGSLAALAQTDVKRMLAYSSIAHAGYILIGFEADTARGRQAALLYLLVYAFMTVGAFGVLAAASRAGDDRHTLEDYRGFASRRPVLSGLLTFFLLAQAGVPLTGGFVAKLEVFSAGIDAQQYGLVVVGVLAAVAAAAVYLRIAVALFSTPTELDAAEEPGPPIDPWSALALTVCAAATLFAGVLPGAWLHFAGDAVFRL